MILNWIRKKLGYHVCEEWTQWETHEQQCSRTPNEKRDGFLAVLSLKTIVYTERWQERRCTLCGKLEQRSVKW